MQECIFFIIFWLLHGYLCVGRTRHEADLTRGRKRLRELILKRASDSKACLTVAQQPFRLLASFCSFSGRCFLFKCDSPTVWVTHLFLLGSFFWNNYYS